MNSLAAPFLYSNAISTIITKLGSLFIVVRGLNEEKYIIVSRNLPFYLFASVNIASDKLRNEELCVKQ